MAGGGKLSLVERALSTLNGGTELITAIQSVLQQPKLLLALREADGMAYFMSLALHCAKLDDLEGMEMLLAAFQQNRDLAQSINKLKQCLLGNIVSRAAIAGLFHCMLSNADVYLIVENAKLRQINPAKWSENGLKYPLWCVYSTLSDDEEFKISALRSLQTLPTANKTKQSELYAFKNEPMVSMNQLEEWLTSDSLETRCAAADLVGVYAGTKFQEQTLKILLNCRYKMPIETFLRAAANACICLAQIQQSKPTKTNTTREMVLPLTQTQQNNTQQVPNYDPPFSYLERFQGQSVLYIAFVDAFKVGLNESLLVAHHFKVIGRALKRTPWQLCQPFWPVIAPKLLKHYDRKVIKSFCELVLDISDMTFLLRTAWITVPYLCSSGNRSQIRACDEIAEARACSVRRLLFDHTAGIVASLLLSSGFNRSLDELDNAWNDAEDRFGMLGKPFKPLKLSKILPPYRVDAIYELIMRTNEQNAALSIGFVHKILYFSYAENIGSSSSTLNINTEAYNEVVQQTVFKLIMKLSKTMRNLMGRESMATKISVLMGLRIFIEQFFSKELIASVLRQLTAFLQSALEMNPLTLTALQTWLAVAQKLDDHKLDDIIDLTYSFINERIDLWDEDCIKCARQIVGYIKSRVREHPDNFKIHPQSAFDTNMNNVVEEEDGTPSVHSSFEQGNSAFDILLSLVERDTENLYVARQTACDLCAFGLEFQPEIIEWAQEEGAGHEILGRAVRVLLNLCGKNEMDLKTTCVRALGLIGALDPHKTSIKPKDPPLIMVSNFCNFNEVVSFCKVLVKDWFLPFFEAAIDPETQRYFAYGIQEMLKFMSAEDQLSLKRIFEDDSLASTLLPLLKTKYTIEIKHCQPMVYPIYRSGILFTDWLIPFCSDMIGRISEPEYAVVIFSWCRKVLFGSKLNPEMWSYLLPYAALAAVVDQKESLKNQEVFVEEVLLILSNSNPGLQPVHEQIFAVIDYFNQWMRSRKQTKAPLLGIDNVLNKIPAKMMAQRALEAGAYPRAIRYYEQLMHEERDSESSVLQDLRHMYGTMQDIDSLEGVSALMPVLTIEQQVLEYRATSQWDAALACYNALPTNEETLKSTLECLHHSGRDKEVLAELTTTKSGSLAALGAECAWTVRDWDALEKWTMVIDPSTDYYIYDEPIALKSQGTTSSQLQPGAVQAVGSALLALRNQDFDAFKIALETGREHVGFRLGEIVSTHHVTSLRQVRDLMVYLHGLADMESLGTLVMPGYFNQEILNGEDIIKTVKLQLDMRLRVLSTLNEGPEFEAKRFLLYLRAATLSCIEDLFPGAKKLIGEAHLEVSASARSHKQLSIALMEIAIAKQLDHTQADVEHAKLLWSQGESRSAIRMLQSQIPQDFFSHPKEHPDVGTLALDWTSWRDVGAQADTRVIVDNYMTVIKSLPKSSEAQYRLAKHYVKIYDDQSVESHDDGLLALSIVTHYGRALLLDTPHHTEALPKMLTTWLDLGITPSRISGSASTIRRHNLMAANKEMLAWGKSINRKLVYNAIPQLLSRLNHPNKDVKKLIEQLIIPVLLAYPRHTLWPILEKGEQTKKIVKEALMKRVKSDDEVMDFGEMVQRSQSFFLKLKTICNTKPKQKEVHLSAFGEDFSQCLQDPLLAVPTQANMDSLGDVFIYDIDPKVAILHSLQRPKRICVYGNNGEPYQLLLKGQDDVRKDARLIEFTSAVNQLLRSNAAAAARHLNIINYRVTPLSASAGIIEWVKGALPARVIIKSLSRRPDFGVNSLEYKKCINAGNRLSERIEAFKELEKMVPPVLWEWFVDTFPDPESWLGARTRFARSLAVMSMVGYILGLGDRHLENILLVQNSGSVLHVDFDCLFDKGKNLTVPELVPFRLTNQFRDALGVVNGYEGPFRKVSELTLKIVRSNEDLLMVVLEAFVHDPVVQDRISNMNPTEALERTRAKIRGLSEANSAPLSVGGLVDELIQSAVSPELLCQMFRGWAAWV